MRYKHAGDLDKQTKFQLHLQMKQTYLHKTKTAFKLFFSKFIFKKLNHVYERNDSLCII
jgi:hypothetical protein